MSRIFITGDTHGDYDVGKLYTRNFRIQSQLTKEDFLIIVGDFGACWYGDRRDDYRLNWYEQRNFTTLFLDGNHENHKRLNAFPVEEWHGGLIHRIRPSVIHLMRGQVYDISGKTFFAMGGAQSVDKWWRIEGCSWWPEELPNEEEYKTATENLDRHNWKVDYVLTHCCGNNITYQLLTHHPQTDKLTDFLMYVDGRLEYRTWFFGHHHIDKMVDRKHRALYNDIIEI